MSKASEWAMRKRQTQDAHQAAMMDRPKVDAWTPECLDWSCLVDNAGDLLMSFKQVSAGETATQITMSPDHALILARWILNTFGDQG